jgi:hypothetical protein
MTAPKIEPRKYSPVRRKQRRQQEPDKQYPKAAYDGSDPEGQPLEVEG